MEELHELQEQPPIAVLSNKPVPVGPDRTVSNLMANEHDKIDDGQRDREIVKDDEGHSDPDVDECDLEHGDDDELHQTQDCQMDDHKVSTNTPALFFNHSNDTLGTKTASKSDLETLEAVSATSPCFPSRGGDQTASVLTRTNSMASLDSMWSADTQDVRLRADLMKLSRQQRAQSRANERILAQLAQLSQTMQQQAQQRHQRRQQLRQKEE